MADVQLPQVACMGDAWFDGSLEVNYTTGTGVMDLPVFFIFFIFRNK